MLSLGKNSFHFPFALTAFFEEQHEITREVVAAYRLGTMTFYFVIHMSNFFFLFFRVLCSFYFCL